jgi:hypothetical protein
MLLGPLNLPSQSNIRSLDYVGKLFPYMTPSWEYRMRSLAFWQRLNPSYIPLGIICNWAEAVNHIETLFAELNAERGSAAKYSEIPSRDQSPLWRDEIASSQGEVAMMASETVWKGRKC